MDNIQVNTATRTKTLQLFEMSTPKVSTVPYPPAPLLCEGKFNFFDNSSS